MCIELYVSMELWKNITIGILFIKFILFFSYGRLNGVAWIEFSWITINRLMIEFFISCDVRLLDRWTGRGRESRSEFLSKPCHFAIAESLRQISQNGH